MNLICNRCDLTGEPRLEYRHHLTGKHLGAWCRSCDSWIKWVPQEGAWLELYEKQQAVPPNPAPFRRREREFLI